MSSLEFKLLLLSLSNLLLSIYPFVISVMIRIGFVGCLISLFSSSSRDWYVSTLVFVKGWNVVAPAFSLNAAIVGKVVERGVVVEVVRSEVAVRGAIVIDC